MRGAEEKVERIMNILQHESLGGYQWREYWQMFKRYGRGEPDFYGRRLMDLELQKKARYVARVCNHARTSKSLPSGRQWGHLRSAMLSIFQPL
jgi:hypothetical protein